MAIYPIFNKHIRKVLHGIITVGLALFTIGAGSPPTTSLSPSEGVVPDVTPAQVGATGQRSLAPDVCLTQAVRITLASEQVSFCAPTSLPFSIVEDGVSGALVNYAGLNQMDGYGIVNVKAMAPGNTPGTGRPVYALDGAAAYRQVVWNMETAKTDRTVSKGPSAIFWNETIPGIQVDVSLPLSTGTVQVRSIEWYVVHNNRLWSFIITWDTGMRNASEWEAASMNMSVQKADGGNLADTALDLGAAFLSPESAPGVVLDRGPIDVGPPSWWKGICDDDNYFKGTGIHSTVLSSWLGVYACGPVPTTDNPVLFPGASFWQLEFECVELVMRFLYLEWGIMPWSGNGNTIMNNPPGSMIFYKNDATHGIVPGDIITENASSQNPYGHTLIVTDISHLDGTGTGTINIMEQNASHAGQRSLAVQNWQVQPDAYCFGQTIQGWLHVKGNQDDGDLDPTYTPGTGPDGRVNAIAIRTSGKILIAGEFSNYNGKPVNRIARLNSDGTLDTGYNPVGVAGSDTPHVYTLAVYSDGKALIGGHFDSYNDTPRKNIARLNSNGTLDITFTPAAEINGDVYKIVLQPDGKILVGGAGFLRRLKSDGTLDSLTATTDNIVKDIAVQPQDGKIIIGGYFSKVGDTNRAGIARLNSNGSLDTDFNPGTGTGANAVEAIALDLDGKVIIGGTFTSYNGTSRNKVARLNSDGSLDALFNPGTGFSGISDSVQTILAQTDGRIWVGGDFSSYNGAVLNHFGRLNHDGSRDTTFFASMDGPVQALALQPDAKILIGGDFTNRVARLYNRIESCYTLTTLATPAAGGSLAIGSSPNCPGSEYISGTLVPITAILNPDYWLVTWSGDASGSSNPLIVTMDADKAVTANLMASPGPFAKKSPENGTIDVPANPGLSWEASNGASSYEYCLYTTNKSVCNSGPWVSTGLNTSASLNNLLPSVTYHWQVRARNLVDTTDGGPWWSFTRDGIPAVPVAVSPVGIIIDAHPTYVWNESNGASSYQVIVYSIGSSASVIEETVGSSVCFGGVCGYHPSAELPLGEYKFKVSATSAGSSDFCAWRTFRVGLGIFMPLITSPTR